LLLLVINLPTANLQRDSVKSIDRLIITDLCKMYNL